MVDLVCYNVYMKWVKIHDGSYKFVEDSDTRPSVKLPKKKLGVPFIPFSPSWKKYEADMHSDNTKVAIAASEKFQAEREHAMKTDSRARNWEEGRKQSWQNDKPAFAKKIQEAGI